MTAPEKKEEKKPKAVKDREGEYGVGGYGVGVTAVKESMLFLGRVFQSKW